jgi:hypothetical protein
MLPIARSAGEPGSEIQAPMAMVILCGLFSSTALNMVVVPVLYERFGRSRPPVASPAGERLGETGDTPRIHPRPAIGGDVDS